MDLIRRETRYVTGVSRSLGGSGDPSAATAYGVLHAMKAVARHLWGTTELAGRHVVVSGVGKVGYNLVRHLVEERARVTVADVDPGGGASGARLRGRDGAGREGPRRGVRHLLAVRPGRGAERRHHPRAAVRGRGRLGQQPAGRARLRRLLADAGVLYAPDYVVNAGGVINIAEELAAATTASGPTPTCGASSTPPWR